MKVNTGGEIGRTFRKCAENVCHCGACEVNNKNYDDYATKRWIDLEDVRKWLKEEVHRSGAPTQLLEEFEKKLRTEDSV